MDIEQHWRTYRDRCVPRHAHAIQLLETKKAFFAGAVLLIDAIRDMEDLEGEQLDDYWTTFEEQVKGFAAWVEKEQTEAVEN